MKQLLEERIPISHENPAIECFWYASDLERDEILDEELLYDKFGVHFDGELHFCLLNSGQLIAYGSIVQDPEAYFQPESYERYLDDGVATRSELNLFRRAYAKMQEKTGVVQIQAATGTADLRDGTSYPELLFEGMRNYGASHGFTVDYVLSGDLVIWNAPWRHRLETVKEVPPAGVLKRNYDVLATNVGFQYDQESGLYLNPDSK